MGQISEDDECRKRQYYDIYRSYCKEPRIYIKDIASLLEVSPFTAAKVVEKASNLGIIVGPQIRKQSFKNTMEYMYFANCKNPFETYLQYSKNMDVVYHARMLGFANTWIISNTEVDVEGDVIAEGPRSDYYVPFTTYRSWEESLKIMLKKIEKFNPGEYESTDIIRTHWDNPITWDSEDEKLFRELKYNLREKITPIMKKNLISAQKIYEFLDEINDRCTVMTNYVFGGISAYDPYIFMFETEYDDFLIDLFSQLPSTPFFFKVSDKLFVYAYAERQLLRCSGLHMANVGQLGILLLIRKLLKRGIIQSEEQAIVAYHWSKEL